MNQSDIEHYFKGIFCSLEQKQDEFKISRFVNGGDFYPLGVKLLFVSLMIFFPLSAIIFGILEDIYMERDFFLFLQ